MALRSGFAISLKLCVKAGLPVFENHMKEVSNEVKIKWRRLIAFSLYKN